LFCLQLVYELKPEKSKVPTFRKIPTVAEVFNNESTLRFIEDSILFTPPRISPLVKTKMGPLHPRIIGLTTQVGKDVYLIQLNSMYSIQVLQRTLFHELAHVYQFERGLLQDMGNMIIWNDTIYGWNQPWADRPWEQHAEKLVEELFVPISEDDI
jgi:hypothetical protein